MDDKARLAKRAEHKRYYAQTAFLYKPRPWTSSEDALILAHDITDRELSRLIRRSMKAISNRRWRLVKENPRKGEIGDTMTNHLPTLTDEQRKANLARAMEVRRERTAFKERVKKGELPFAEAIGHDLAKRLHVRELLMCVPGIGGKKSLAIMAEIGIAQNRRVQGLGRRQRESLIGAVEAHVSAMGE